MAKQPEITPLPSKRGPLYRLLEEQISNDDEYSIIVPKGFVYDGASVPQWAWSITGLLPDGINRRAALFHDWIYANDGKEIAMVVDGEIIFRDFTRREADELFREMLKTDGVSYFKRNLQYYAVRVGGGAVWAAGDGVPRMWNKDHKAPMFNSLWRKKLVKKSIFF